MLNIQDELVEKLKRYDPKSRNYYASVTKACRKARRELIYLGYEYDLDQMIQDCHDMAALERNAVDQPAAVGSKEWRKS